METVVIDTTGLKCPQPLLKLAARSAEMRPGETIEVIGDCPTFQRDIKAWCDRLKKTLVEIKDEGGDKKRCIIRL
jgi:tRNA 2-thiouridine synthesizing protein A